MKSLNIFLLFILIALNQCYIKRKGSVIANKTKEKIFEKKDAAFDKLIPTFDCYTPDSKFNIKRFKEFFGFEPTSDVKNVYCFADQIGINSKYQFSFNSNVSTKNRIVEYLKLQKTEKPDNYSSGLWKNFNWWDSSKIIQLNPYLKKSESRFYKYLWYDSLAQKVYYIDFDN